MGGDPPAGALGRDGVLAGVLRGGPHAHDGLDPAGAGQRLRGRRA